MGDVIKFPGEEVVVIDSCEEFYAVATSKSVKTFARDDTEVLSFEVVPDLQPIRDLKFDPSFKFFGVVGGTAAWIFDATNADIHFHLQLGGERPVGIRFDHVRKFIVVATETGNILMFSEPDSTTPE